MHTQFQSLFNAGDLNGLVALYEPDAVLNLPQGTVRGHAAIREALNGFLSVGGKVSLTEAGVLEGPGGIALTHCTWKLTGGSVELGGKTAEVPRRQPDGNWLYLIDNPYA